MKPQDHSRNLHLLRLRSTGSGTTCLPNGSDIRLKPVHQSLRPDSRDKTCQR